MSTSNSSSPGLSGGLGLLFDYCTAGIDFDLPGNGGPDCRDFVPGLRRALECALGLAVSGAFLYVGLRRHRPPPLPSEVVKVASPDQHYSPFRLLLLVSLAFVYGLEVCYKLATKQAIFIINPCHVLCLVHLLLLAWPQNTRFVTYLFRLHLFFLHGPLMAVIFPVTNTLFLPFEVLTYWLEHALLLFIPFYLLRRGGPLYTVAPWREWGWACLAYGIWGLYHFVVLEGVALLTLANLNSMLCPAISDPFYGPHYRLYALGHQCVLTMISGKLFSLFGVTEPACEMKEKMPSDRNVTDNAVTSAPMDEETRQQSKKYS